MRLIAPFGLVALALAAVIWLDRSPTDADLVFVNTNEVFTLDPQRMSYLQDLRLAHVLYEGLVRWDNRTFAILPAAATDLPEIGPDGLTHTFRIRPDARWSNGHPVTAHDFVYSWQRAILPDTAADYSNMFFVIDGAEAIFDWRLRQTADFNADPWSDEGAGQTEAVLAMVRRLERLLDAEALPRAIAMPAEGDLAPVRSELEDLASAAEPAGGSGLAIALGAAARTEAWWEALDDRSSRAAEAAWMWEQLEDRLRAEVALRAVDDRTLEVRLRRPTAYFLDLLCFGVFFPVHRPTVEGWPEDVVDPDRGWHALPPPPMDARSGVRLEPVSGKLQQRHDWAKAGRHVGNGTHRLAEWRYKRDLRLERNEYYHDPERVRAGSILALTIEDPNTAVLAFESGRVDWLADVSAEYQADMIQELDTYLARHGVDRRAPREDGSSLDAVLTRLPPAEPGERRNIHVFPTFGTDFFSFNCRPLLSDGRPNVFAEARVRRAFTRAVDKQAIVTHVTRLGEPVVTTLIPPDSIEGYASPRGLAHDPEQARRELRDAGWEDRDEDGFVENAAGEPFPVIDLLYTTNTPRYKWISLDLKAQWERELGVRVELRGSETKFYKEDLKQGKFMIARSRWYGDYGDPTTFLDLCRKNDGNNDRGYDNPVIDDLLDRASVERDPARRMRLLEECERIICDEDAPMLPLCQLVQVYMYEPGRVTGLSDHPRLTQFLWQMEVVGP